MPDIGALTVPLVLLAVALHGLAHRVDVYGKLVAGAGAGLSVLVKIVPALVALLAAVGMLRASGFLDWLTDITRPAFALLGIPSECAPLILLRPFSGSGALALGADIMGRYGVDSVPGVTAAVMLGSTETLFYTLSVYLGGAGVTKARRVLPAALISDFAGVLAASWAVALTR